MANTSFRFKSSYLNSSFFEATTPTGERFEVEFRRATSDYEASIHAAGPDAYATDCARLVGRLKAPRPLDHEVIADFNSWRLAEHAAFEAEAQANPARYGAAADIPPPALARGAAWYDAAIGSMRFLNARP